MKNKTLPLVLAAMISGCAPSLSYRLGQGFYSEQYARTQVQAAANLGRLTNLGRFTTEAGACGNYSQDAADRNTVEPAVRAKLAEMKGNAADNIVANEYGSDFFLGLLMIPAWAACSNWTISGEALRVEEAAK